MKMKRNYRITESKLRNIILESVRKTINEIDLETAEKARNASEYWAGLLEDAYDEWENATETLCKTLQNRYGHGLRDYDDPNPNTQGTKLSYELTNLQNKIKSFVERKRKQHTSFDYGVDDKFIERFGATDNDMTHKLGGYAKEHGWESMDNAEWRKDNLTPIENDYYDYKEKTTGGF